MEIFILFLDYLHYYLLTNLDQFKNINRYILGETLYQCSKWKVNITCHKLKHNNKYNENKTMLLDSSWLIAC